ncbi:carbohydrate ABC transporter permease [Cohnella thailandensis]|uniref:carbohydrate ABC transporter permease n=1 Tax=Cohnella thailandensis TaxID=557557 RepID=UPI001AE68B67|nr:sugar ABC transporter permease [Cohnella thailandensis]MBP1973200.1 multiple sugar transport system permease protein [Cohnella thailandensis]
MTPKRISARTRNEWVTAYGFLLPNLIGLFVFVFVPIVYALYVSLHDWNALNPKAFSGLDNYRKLLHDDQWWSSIRITLTFSVIYVPLLFVLSLLSALLMNALRGRTKGVARTLFLLPFAVTSVTSAVIGMFMLDPRNGVINRLLGLIGIGPQPFLGSTSQAMLSIIGVILWINIGYNMIIFLSAIKEIPRDYYEAAGMDGATGWKSFRFITLPLLRETSTFILIVTTIGSFQALDQILVMTKGGPANAMEVSVLYIFKQGFELLNMGYAASLAFVLFLIIFGLSLVQLKLFSNRN